MAKISLSVKKMLFYCMIATVIVLAGAICTKAEGVYTFSDESVLNTRINTQGMNGENVIVLPSSVKADSLLLYGEFPENADVYVKGLYKTEAFYSGERINLNDLCGEDYYLTFFDKNGTFNDFTVRFLFSENIPAVFIVSDNPEENGRLWVEESKDKSNKATGNMVMQNPGGELVYNGALTQIKGRGNSTWMQPKKPYQIKTDKKVDLLQTGDDNNKSKTWVLLANYMDPSLLHNSLALKIGEVLGMRVNIESTHVDLYYDGEYRGSYLLAEKVELGSGRVAVEDLEEKNEGANEGVDIENLPIKTGETANGAIYTYCDGLASPEDITGGYLIEMDFEVRAKEEICYFKTKENQYVVVKSPEYASREEMEYIATLYQEYEDAIYNGGINPTTGKSYKDYVDADSIVNYYLVNEFSKARDFFKSSAYLHKNAGEDKMYMSPLWDYDQSFEGGNFEEGIIETPYGQSIHNTKFSMKLLEAEGFAELLKNAYNERFLPFITSAVSSEEVTKDTFSLNNVIEKIRSSATINNMMWYSDREWEKEVENNIFFIQNRIPAVKELLDVYTSDNVDENRFYDVLPTAWFYDAVHYVKSIGYMNGVGNNFFEPYSNVRRAEIAQVLYNIEGYEKVYTEKSYLDVDNSDWFYNAIEWAKENNIMYGFENNIFGPNEYITREALITCLYRYKNQPNTEGGKISLFADGQEISSFAENAVEWAIENGIIIGDENNYINPKAYLTRAELATILLRFSEL